MSTETIVIKHGISLTQEFLLGADPGFPSTAPLTPYAVRRAQLALIGYGVVKFDDGMYHAEVHTFAFYDLLNCAGEEAVKIQTKPDATKQGVFNAFGLRWDVSPAHRVVRIYGPHSDPTNAVEIDLTGGI